MYDVGVDALLRRFGYLVLQYTRLSSILIDTYRKNQLIVYIGSIDFSSTTKIELSDLSHPSM